MGYSKLSRVAMKFGAIGDSFYCRPRPALSAVLIVLGVVTFQSSSMAASVLIQTRDPAGISDIFGSSDALGMAEPPVTSGPTSGALTFSQFDPALGNLTGVVAEFDGGLRTRLIIEEGKGARAETSTQIELSYGSQSISTTVDYSLIGSISEVKPIPTLNLNLGGTLPSFVGTGSVNLGLALEGMVTNIIATASSCDTFIPPIGPSQSSACSIAGNSNFLSNDALAELRYEYEASASATGQWLQTREPDEIREIFGSSDAFSMAVPPNTVGPTEDQITFSQFDPNLGTLTGVTVELEGGLRTRLVIEEGRGANATTETIIELFYAGQGVSALVEHELSGSDSEVEPFAILSLELDDNLGDFIGIGTVDIDLILAGLLDVISSSGSCDRVSPIIGPAQSGTCSVAGISDFGNTGSIVSLSYDFLRSPPSAVPVPSAVWLFGTALMGLVGFGKRRHAV